MARSISPWKELMGWWREDLDPRKHITAERRREKLSLHLSQFMVLLYGLLCLSAISEAILLYTTFAVATMPPATKKACQFTSHMATFAVNLCKGSIGHGGSKVRPRPWRPPPKFCWALKHHKCLCMHCIESGIFLVEQFHQRL